jgi:hypothetical protein
MRARAAGTTMTTSSGSFVWRTIHERLPEPIAIVQAKLARLNAEAS